MDELKKEVGLVALRKEAGVTQKKMAEELGITIQTVRNWEQGKTVPQLSIPQVKRLCKLFKRSLDDLPDSLGPDSVESSDQATRVQLNLI